MTTEVVAPARLVRAVRLVVDGVLVQRIAEGRLRNVGWPRGWSAVIGIGYIGFAATAALVLTGWWWRRQPLIQTGDGLQLIPQTSVWIFALLIMTVAALLHLGALHGVWWSKITTLVVGVVLAALWPATILTVASPLLALPGVACVVALLVLSLVRMRRSPRWWEFVAYWVLFTAPVIMAMVAIDRVSRPLGFDVIPPLLAQTVGLLAFLCAPVAVASGTAVAELTVSATVWVAVAAGRVGRRPVLLGLLVVAVAGRAVQAAYQLDDDTLRWTAAVPVVVTLALLAGISLLLLRRSGMAQVQVTELPEDLTRIAMPIGVALQVVLVPLSLLLLGIQLSFSVSGVETGLVDQVTAVAASDLPVAVVRALTVLGLLVLAVRAADRRRLGTAVLEGHIAVFLLPAPVGILTQAPFAVGSDPDLLNLAISVLAVGAALGCLVRGGLTSSRIVALLALIVLGVVFSARAVVLAPLSWLFGPSAALVLVGLVWTLLTGCDRANVNGRRFSATSRSAMMIGFVLLTGVVLAFSTLAGTPSQGALDLASSLGDAVLGTSLLTATVTLLLLQVRARTMIT